MSTEVCTALISLCTTSKRKGDKGTFVLTRDPVTKGSEGTLAVEYKLVYKLVYMQKSRQP